MNEGQQKNWKRTLVSTLKLFTDYKNNPRHGIGNVN